MSEYVTSKICMLETEINQLNKLIEKSQLELRNKRFELLQTNEYKIKENLDINGLNFPDDFFATSPTKLEYLNDYLKLFNASSNGRNINFNCDTLDLNKIKEFINIHKNYLFNSEIELIFTIKHRANPIWLKILENGWYMLGEHKVNSSKIISNLDVALNYINKQIL